MTLHMYLLEHETLSIKMLRKGKSFDEVHEFTDLPFDALNNSPTIILLLEERKISS